MVTDCHHQSILLDLLRPNTFSWLEEEKDKGQSAQDMWGTISEQDSLLCSTRSKVQKHQNLADTHIFYKI